MKYMLLIYTNENEWSDEDRAACYRTSSELVEELKTQGHLLGANPLHPVSTATTLRILDGKRLITDGPFAETREQLGGYFLIEARDLNEALQIAGRIPAARKGTVEIRPVLELPVLAAAQ